MTATPIPRTLILTLFGDMALSELREKPPGRQKIDTRAVSLDRLEETTEAVGRALASGAQVYWICPLVEESEHTDLATATDRFAALQERFGARVAWCMAAWRRAKRMRPWPASPPATRASWLRPPWWEVGVNVPTPRSW